MKRPGRYFRLLLLLVIACSIPAIGCAGIDTRPGSGGVNAAGQRDKPYVVLISIDGFRWDYQDLYSTPAMDRLAARGVRAESMTPVFPTLTFPNHYSIATGLYPAKHGIVANDFRDKESHDWYAHKDSAVVQQGRWYGGQPIWVAAEKNGMVSAAFFFVGTEAAIGGVAPTYWNQFDEQVPGARRVAQVLDWLAMPIETRPHLITLYFEHVDADTHQYGIGSRESVAAIERVDGYLGRLMDGIDKLPYADDIYIILVSDHGQSSYDQSARFLCLDGLLDLDDISIVEGGTFAYLFLDRADPARAEHIRDEINRVWRHGRAWLPAEAPARWHINDTSSFPDVIVQPDPHFGVVSRKQKLANLTRGDHGWDPSFRDMHGIFLAAGARLPKGVTIGAIDNLDVYPLMMAILGIPLTAPIDGNPATLVGLLDTGK